MIIVIIRIIIVIINTQPMTIITILIIIIDLHHLLKKNIGVLLYLQNVQLLLAHLPFLFQHKSLYHLSLPTKLHPL
jgi:hypothetical protein